MPTQTTSRSSLGRQFLDGRDCQQKDCSPWFLVYKGTAETVNTYKTLTFAIWYSTRALHYFEDILGVSYPHIISRPLLLEVLINLIVIPAHVGGIPPITTGDSVGKRRCLALEGRIATAHDALPEVLEAVVEMPRRLLWHVVCVVRRHARVDLYDCVETVQLVGHGCCEDRGGVAF